jgi:hypothetical protein
VGLKSLLGEILKCGVNVTRGIHILTEHNGVEFHLKQIGFSVRDYPTNPSLAGIFPHYPKGRILPRLLVGESSLEGARGGGGGIPAAICLLRNKSE